MIKSCDYNNNIYNKYMLLINISPIGIFTKSRYNILNIQSNSDNLNVSKLKFWTLKPESVMHLNDHIHIKIYEYYRS